MSCAGCVRCSPWWADGWSLRRGVTDPRRIVAGSPTRTSTVPKTRAQSTSAEVMQSAAMDRPQSRSAAITELLGPSTLTGRSSVELGWDGLAIERRIIQPGEKTELPIGQHFLLLWDNHVAVGESERRPGTFAPYKKLPNTITTCPPGVRPATRS